MFKDTEELATRRRAWFTRPTRETSLRMKLVRSSDTHLERAMERILRLHCVRYVKQPKLIGKPDFKVKETNIVIFCDSSFWHGRRQQELEGRAFKKNRAFWTAKLMNNRLRDMLTNRRLQREGWRILRFWDTDILKRPKKVVERLTREIHRNG